MQQFQPLPGQSEQPSSEQSSLPNPVQPVPPYANQPPQFYGGPSAQPYQIPYSEQLPQQALNLSQPVEYQQFANPAQTAQQPQAPGGQPQVVVQHFYGAPVGQPSVTINIVNHGPNFLMRVLYFIFIGWWAGFFWLNLGFFLCFTVVLLPVGLVMLNNLPGVMTLRPKDVQTSVSVSGNNVTVNVAGTQQQSFLIRALYYVFVGWWAGYIWALMGYLCCLTGVLIPVGLLMLNRLPMVLTLRRN